MNKITITRDVLTNYDVFTCDRNPAGRFNPKDSQRIWDSVINDKPGIEVEADLILVVPFNEGGGHSIVPAHPLLKADEVRAAYGIAAEWHLSFDKGRNYEHSPEAVSAMRVLDNITRSEKLKEIEKEKARKERAASSREHAFSGLHHAFKGVNL